MGVCKYLSLVSDEDLGALEVTLKRTGVEGSEHLVIAGIGIRIVRQQ